LSDVPGGTTACDCEFGLGSLGKEEFGDGMAMTFWKRDRPSSGLSGSSIDQGEHDRASGSTRDQEVACLSGSKRRLAHPSAIGWLENGVRPAKRPRNYAISVDCGDLDLFVAEPVRPA
jgi:hypothetical protein